MLEVIVRKLNHIQAALHAHLSAMHHTTSVNKSDTNSKITMFITGGAMGGGKVQKVHHSCWTVRMS